MNASVAAIATGLDKSRNDNTNVIAIPQAPNINIQNERDFPCFGFIAVFSNIPNVIYKDAPTEYIISLDNQIPYKVLFLEAKVIINSTIKIMEMISEANFHTLWFSFNKFGYALRNSCLVPPPYKK